MENEKTNETLTKTISIRLTESEMDTFQQICDKLNTSKSVFLRDLIQNINTRLEDDLYDDSDDDLDDDSDNDLEDEE